MRRALLEGMKGVGQTSPNPSVGAVVVRNGRVVATGYHRRAGAPHAEAEALQTLGSGRARGATLYVTLEPCSTHGRTPPCVEAIARAGIARVVVGTVDPNPRHQGNGLRMLAGMGIHVVTGVLVEQCANLIAPFAKWISTGRPFVIAKCGMSLDGRITRPAVEGRWITGAAARADTHKLRAEVDAILVGGETLRTDNPRLTVRGIAGARQPWRVVISRSGRLPAKAHLFSDQHRDRTLVYLGKSLPVVLRDLGRREVTSLLIEGGMRVLGEALDRRLVDRVQMYLAPLFLGGPKICIGGRGVGSTRSAPKITRASYRRVGMDVCMTGDVIYPDQASESAASD